VLPGWDDVAVVSAEIRPLRGEEFLQAQQLDATLTHRITLRYRAGIQATWRAVSGDRAFNFAAPPMDIRERHRMLEILAKEIA
jgi:SPP1 family predicted phage head-tail adaptor